MINWWFLLTSSDLQLTTPKDLLVVQEALLPSETSVSSVLVSLQLCCFQRCQDRIHLRVRCRWQGGDLVLGDAFWSIRRQQETFDECEGLRVSSGSLILRCFLLRRQNGLRAGVRVGQNASKKKRSQTRTRRNGPVRAARPQRSTSMRAREIKMFKMDFASEHLQKGCACWWDSDLEGWKVES